MSGSWLVMLVLVTSSAAALQAQPAPVTLPASRQFEFHSQHTGRDYRLFVSLPEKYSESDTARYPVFYVLDGNGFFALATETHRLLRLDGEVPELIIVGVGYPIGSFAQTSGVRWRDYTPSPDATADSTRAVQLGERARGIELHSGGGPTFVATLKTEIIPFIEQNFRTTPDRGLFGNSLSALLASYILVTSPDTFSRYAISSPSLWWNNGETFAREIEYAKSHTSLNARVFVSVGSEETPRMISTVERFVSTLREGHLSGLEITEHSFEDETHDSVGPAALSRALRFLYGSRATR